MNIFINTTKDKITLLNKPGGLFFSNDVNTAAEVSIVIADADLETILEKVTDIPTVVLVGVHKDRNSDVAKSLLNRGMPQESLIYKDGGYLKNHLGEPLKTLVPRGVGYNALKELAEYAKSKNLLPEAIVWNPDKTTNEAIIDFPAEPTKPEAPQIKPEVPQKKPEQKKAPQVTSETPVAEPVKTVALSNFVKDYEKIILLMKTSVGIDTSKLIHSLRDKQEFKLLDITDQHKSINGQNLNEAVKTGYYSYLDKELVYTYGPKHPLLMIEFDFFGANSDLINSLYEVVGRKYFVPIANKNDLQTVKDWLNNGLELDGIIAPNEEALNYYRKEFSEHGTFTADTLTL